MKLKRITKLRSCARTFEVKWDKELNGASLNYSDKVITIGTNTSEEAQVEYVVHELWELCALEMCVRHQRPDCMTDFIFVYDHRQHDTMCNMFTGLLTQFLR